MVVFDGEMLFEAVRAEEQRVVRNTEGLGADEVKELAPTIFTPRAATATNWQNRGAVLSPGAAKDVGQSVDEGKGKRERR